MRLAIHLLLSGLTGATLLQTARPTGPIRIQGHAVADDRGPFPALGASLFWAAWAYKNDRTRLDAHLQLLAKHNVDYIRALGIVGRQPYWQGREIDWRWPEYDSVIAGLTDYAFDKFGIRVEWTIFADAEQMIPEAGERMRLVDRFVAMSRGREQKIMHFELANESWQNGFDGPEGVEQLRSLARHLDERTTIPVAVSDSQGHDCADHAALYSGLTAQIMTEHFPRDRGGASGVWGPVLAPWAAPACEGLPAVISSNEPIGPRSSVDSESDPQRIVAAAVVSWMAGVGLYVFHTDAGVWGRESLESMPAATEILDGLANVRRYVPADLANWRRLGNDADHPLGVQGARQTLFVTKDDRFFAAVLGGAGSLGITAKRPVQLEIVDGVSGVVLQEKALAAGEQISVRTLAFSVLRGTVIR